MRYRTIAILLSVVALAAGWAINGDTDISDFLLLLALWGPNPGRADLNGDGFVGINDFLLLLANWGPCP